MNGMEELIWLRKENAKLVEENTELKRQLAAAEQLNGLFAAELDKLKKRIEANGAEPK